VRWQRVARVVVAALGVGTAVALYMLTRPRPVTVRQSSSTNADPNATLQAGSGTNTTFRGNELERKLEYQSVRQYADGRIGWTGFKLTMSDGTVIVADVGETTGKAATGEMPRDMVLKGHVRFQAPDAVSFTSEEMRYTDAVGQATIPGAMTFTRGRMSGTGTGAVYQRDTGVFKLLADAHMVTQPGDPDGQIDATADTLTFNRAGNALLFDTHAHIAHDADLMTADRATLYLTEDHEQFKVIELRGNSHVAPTPGKVSNTPEMQAQDIDLAFYEGTQTLQRAVLNRQASLVLVDGTARRAIAAQTVQLSTAPDGKTVTHLEGVERVTVKTPAQNGTPERTITAASLVANGDDKTGLTAAQFSGGVRFVEVVPGAGGRGGSTRTGTSQSLNLKLKGQLDAIDEAQFLQNTKFDDGDVTGSADQGIYYASKGQLTLQPFARNGKLMPHVTDGSVTVDATELVDVNLDTNDLHARKDVKTVTAGKPSEGTTAQTGLFSSQDTTYGFSTEFWYWGASKNARYVGTATARAQVKQTDSQVLGGDLTIVNDTQDLQARGSVESTFTLNDQPQTPPAPASKSAAPAGAARGAAASKAAPAAPATKYRITAETLDYVDAARTATYTGAPVTMTSPDRTTKSGKLVLTLAATSRTLEQLEGTTDVHVTLTDGREALSDRLLYEAGRERYTLRGRVLLREPDDKPGSCAVTRATVVYFTSGDKSPVVLADENPLGWDRTPMTTRCTSELKR
jgi:lipopolysaccharide export system protein LptA